MSAFSASYFGEEYGSDRGRNQIIGESHALKSVLDKVE